MSLLQLISLSSLVLAAPTPRDSPQLDDTQILQFALTLEHLENAFYTLGLQQFDEDAFARAGLPDFTRGRFQQIAEHEATHVQYLSTILGSDAPQPCQYSFPFNDPTTFVELASVLENGGTSAYLGATSAISSKTILQTAGSILTTEARQNAWIHSAVLKLEPWSRAFDTPLTPNQIFSIAHNLITSCPPSNPQLPVRAFPSLNVSQSQTLPGDTIDLQFEGDPSNNFLALLAGLNTTYIPIQPNGKATLPTEIQGTAYGLVTSSDSNLTDDNTIAGVVVFQFPFSSKVDNPN